MIGAMESIGRLGWIQVDCADPRVLATFWGSVFGVDIDQVLGDPAQYVNLAPISPGQLVVSFQRVPEAKTVKNRLHFDVSVGDVEAASSRIERLGGGRITQPDISEYGFTWRVMVDPAGNEFCLIF